MGGGKDMLRCVAVVDGDDHAVNIYRPDFSLPSTPLSAKGYLQWHRWLRNPASLPSPPFTHPPPWNQRRAGHPFEGVSPAGTKTRAWNDSAEGVRSFTAPTGMGLCTQWAMAESFKREAGVHCADGCSVGRRYWMSESWRATYSGSRRGRMEGWRGWWMGRESNIVVNSWWFTVERGSPTNGVGVVEKREGGGNGLK